jgi:hypothetical protein
MKRVHFSEVTGVRALKRLARELGTEEKPIVFKEI